MKKILYISIALALIFAIYWFEVIQPRLQNNSNTQPNSEEVFEDKPDVESQLSKYIEEQSKGVMSFNNFNIIKSNKLNYGGSEIYKYEGDLTVNILKSCYRITKSYGQEGGTPGLFYSQENQPESTNPFGFIESKFYDANSTLLYNNLSLSFTKYDQGWLLEKVGYE